MRTRLIAALVAAAVVVLGFGHVPAGDVRPGGLDPSLAAYLQAGGSLDDLCLADDPNGSGHHEDGQQHCPLCVLTKAFALAAPPTVPMPSERPATAVALPEMRHLASGHTPRAPPARGPPTSLV